MLIVGLIRKSVLKGMLLMELQQKMVVILLLLLGKHLHLKWLHQVKKVPVMLLLPLPICLTMIS